MEPQRFDKTFSTTTSTFGEHSGWPPLIPFPLTQVFPETEIIRDPLNGAWCDSLYHPDHPWMDPDKEDYEELTPCGEDNNFYSSAGPHI